MRIWVQHLLSECQRLAHPRQYQRGQWILLSLILFSLILFRPQVNMPNRVVDWLIVMDVTQSMNVRDYTLNGKGVSRLEYAKQAVRKSLQTLPCGSRVALAMFAERESLTLVKPVEICAHFSVLDQAIEKLDWRMAWAADSFIAHGVFKSIENAKILGTSVRVMFISDGHQAPPANPKYMPIFSGKVGEVKGVIVGSGQLAKSPIPKLDDRNEISGYWTTEDIQQFGLFGMAETLSVLAMEQGQHDRNAGHGAGGGLLEGAHLSGMDKTALKAIAQQTGLRFEALQTPEQLSRAMNDIQLATLRNADTDLRTWIAWPAYVLLWLYVLSVLEMRQVINLKRFSTVLNVTGTGSRNKTILACIERLRACFSIFSRR